VGLLLAMKQSFFHTKTVCFGFSLCDQFGFRLLKDLFDVCVFGERRWPLAAGAGVGAGGVLGVVGSVVGVGNCGHRGGGRCGGEGW